MQQLTGKIIRSMVGDVSDHAVVEILEMGATARDIEKALAFEAVGQESESVDTRRLLSGRAARIHEILFKESGGFPEEREAV